MSDSPIAASIPIGKEWPLFSPNSAFAWTPKTIDAIFVLRYFLLIFSHASNKESRGEKIRRVFADIRSGKWGASNIGIADDEYLTSAVATVPDWETKW